MSEANTYMTIDPSTNIQQLLGLEGIVNESVKAAIIAELNNGVPVVKATDYVALAGNVATSPGIIRLHDGASPYIEFSNDGGTTWLPLQSITVDWDVDTRYAVDAVVRYKGAWYACVESCNGVSPLGATQWRLLSTGKDVIHVHNSSQFKAALETKGDSVEIQLHGDMSGVVQASVVANRVSIWSDESTSLGANINLNIANGSNVWWHSSGTRTAEGISIDGGSGVLWIDRLNSGGNLKLGSTVVYQRIDGAFTGGKHLLWTIPSEDASSLRFVPQNMADLVPAAYAGDANIFIDGGSSNRGKLPLSILASKAGSEAIKYLRINEQGLLSQRPQTADFGYLYLATDTGDVYRMGEGGTWDEGVHIQGPPGSPGEPGKPGKDGVSPVVTVTKTDTGHRVNITDETHPGGQNFDVPDGKDGKTITLNMGTVSTLKPGSQATASLSSEDTAYWLNLGIPEGKQGAGSDIDVEAPLELGYNAETSRSVLRLPHYPWVALESGGAEDTATSLIPGHSYDFSDLTVTTLTVALGGTYTEEIFGECWLKIKFGSTAKVVLGDGIRVMDTPFPNSINLLHVVIWGQELFVHVMHHYSYNQNGRYGSIRVLYPDQNIPEGAQWSLDNGNNWHDFGTIVTIQISNISPTITFKAVTGKTEPAAVNTGLLSDKLVTVVSGAYT